jgi:hypothetical protein
MGYRSSVAFCLSVNSTLVKPETGESYWDYDRAKFKEMVGFFKLTKFYEEATSADYNCITQGNLGWQKGEIIFHAEEWKWYSDYDIVKAFKEMWENMQDIEGISGYFLRVGEGDGDAPDVEQEEFGDDPNYDNFGAYTNMYFNDDETLGKTETDEEGQTEQAQTHTDSQPDCAGASHATQQECGEAQA